jgi:NAD(P)-dependent dehydrogenase (short-subunit alcohol dehydrogenase family)
MKTVLITGGSGGIGSTTAKLFAEEGYLVALSYNTNKEGAEKVVEEITQNSGTAISYQSELSTEASAKELVEWVHSQFGRIDVLVNNAGKYIDGDEWSGTQDIWMQTLMQDLVSVMNVSKYCIPIFEKQQSGVMVNIASRLGLSGSYEELAYGAAKAGVINITQAYAKLLAPYGRANSVSPGAVNTGYWLRAPQAELEATVANKPLKRLIEPIEVAYAILYLGTDRSASTTGQNLVVN